MASKIFTLEEIGDVAVYKRRGTSRINLRIVGAQVRVTQPAWLPYAAGVKFATSHTEWILRQRQHSSVLTLASGNKIGKARTMLFEYADTLRTRITAGLVIVYMPPGTTPKSPDVQEAAKKAVKRALKREAEGLLPQRLALLAQKYDFEYTKVTCKSMRTRWGSCNNLKQITLNIYLLMTPWELIDYVLVHELVHTRHLHHGPEFWHDVAAIIPDHKERRRQLKILQRKIAPLQ